MRRQLSRVSILACLLIPAMAMAEGTQQVGADQDFHPGMKFKVDILNVGEVINISAGVNLPDSPKPLDVTVRGPDGKHVTGSPFSIAKNKPGWLGTPGVLPPATITNPLQIVSTMKGTHTITFNNKNLTWLDPLDITVTSKKADPVKPALTIDGKGRVHAVRWTMQGKSFKDKTNANFFVHVPTGSGTDYTWLLEFNGLSGKIYDVIANAKGIPAPYSNFSESKIKVPKVPLGQYEIYLFPPAKAKGGTVAPVLTGFNFGGCTKWGANSISGQKSQFSFNSNVVATYDIILDTDKDGKFDLSKDLFFTGTAKVGLNTVTWNGNDAQGKVVLPGNYDAYISLRLGEFHFVAEDIETVNPGLRIFGIDPPASITTMNPKSANMYWNDTRVQKKVLPVFPVTSLPTGISSGPYTNKPVCSKPANATSGINTHCWGNFTDPPTDSPGEETFVDTWVYAAENTAKVKITVLNGNSDTDGDTLTNQDECIKHGTDPNKKDTDGDGLNDNVEVNAVNKTDPTKKDTDNDGLTDGEEDKNKNGKVDPGETDPTKADTDGDGLKDGVEVKGTNKTDPLKKDTDNDGLSDGIEDKNKNGQVDTGETDPNKWDTDNGGESDGSEVKNGRNPLNPNDDFGGPDLGVPDAGPDQLVPDQMVADQKVITPDQKVVTPDQKVTTPDQKVTTPDQKVTTPDQKVAVKDGSGPGKEAGPAADKGTTPGADSGTTGSGGLFFFGGGGCSVSGDDDGLSGLMLLLPLALLFAVRRKRGWLRRSSIAALALFVVLLAAPSARAQGTGATPPTLQFNSMIWQPAAATTINFFHTEGATLLPHLTPSAGVYFAYVHKPVQVWDEGKDETAFDVIKYQVTMDVLVAFGLFDRVEIGLGLPVALTQDSDSLTTLGRSSAMGTGIGDLRIIVKGRLVTLGPVSIGLALPLTVPTGKDEYLLGDDGVTFTPKAVFSVDTKWFDAGLNVGYRLRPRQVIAYNGVLANSAVIDDEVVFSLGLKAAIWQEKIDFIVDGFASLTVDEQDKEEIPAEVLGGLRFYLPKGFTAHVGAGPGLTRGVATPVFRAFAGIGYQYIAPPPPPPVVDKDPDKDGILDPNDKCPNEPEDKDGYEDEDGCPDTDNDNDGILDAKDKCPLKPEDKDEFEDVDGCPDPDNDKDGILDVSDKCPLQPEDKDGFEDTDGCPDPDNDKDGILDKDDKCPVEPESFNGYQDEDGCMDVKPKAKVQITRTAITVPPVYFATNKDQILKRSHPTLMEVVDLLKKNKWVKKIRIEGHTDERGNDAFNLDLSQRRANSVLSFLTENGLEAGRLEAKGYGEVKPIASNKTRKGRAQNRRVEFIILDPAQKKPGSSATSPVEKKVEGKK